MNAVWSFWTKPYFLNGKGRWYSELHHWLAWGLSLFTAQRFYSQTCLVTDDAGARILIDELELPFACLSTGLNVLADQDPGWWALGKLEAHRLQQTPFVHLDPDVFLWKRLASELEAADVFTQNPMPLNPDMYRPAEFEDAVGHPASGWLPKEWRWYRRQAANQRAACCGIIGGVRLDFIHDYARTGLRLIADPRNADLLRICQQKTRHMFLIEEYALSACVEYHRRQKKSPYHGIEIRYLFPSLEDAFKPEYTTMAGFTHLAGAMAKKDPQLARQLEHRVKRDLPRFYQRCLKYCSSRKR